MVGIIMFVIIGALNILSTEFFLTRFIAGGT